MSLNKLKWFTQLSYITLTLSLSTGVQDVLTHSVFRIDTNPPLVTYRLYVLCSACCIISLITISTPY